MAHKTRTHKTRTPGLYRVDPSRIYKEGAWEVRYRDAFNGTRRKTFRTKQEALDFQASVRTDKNRGDFIDPKRAATPLASVAERWFETTADLKPKTLAGYRSILDTHVLPELGDLPVGKIRPSDLKAMLAGRGVSVTTQRNILRVLSPIFNLAVDDGMIRTNPCPRVKLPRAAQAEMHFLSAEEVAVLAEEISPRYRTLIYFASYTGMRAGEIAGLRVRLLDLMRGRVTVKETVSDVGGTLHFGTPKNGRTRTVALPGFLRDMLMEQVAGKDPDDFVFTSPGGGPLRHGNFYGRHFKPAVRRALPEHLHGLRFHDLRHTAASLLIARGVHPKAIANHLGHSSIAITMDRYGHLYPDHEEAIVQGMEETYTEAAKAATGEAIVHQIP